MRLFAAFILTALVSKPHTANPSASTIVMLRQPFGEGNAVLAPNGKDGLWGDYQKSKLWLDNNETRTKRLVGPYTVQTVSLVWAPDSRHFVVNDRETSTESVAYLFDTETLKRTDLREQLIVAFPASRQFLVSSRPNSQRGTVSHGREVLHSYVDVRRWIDSEHVELELHGSFGGRFRHNNPDQHLYSGGCFDIRYRMALDGSVQETSRNSNILDPSSAACGW